MLLEELTDLALPRGQATAEYPATLRSNHGARR
jgi:hypothetical protein